MDERVMLQPSGVVISVMLAVEDAAEAVEWYKHALGATVLWDLRSAAGLQVAGACFFVAESADNGWEAPSTLGTTSTRVDLFCD